MKRCDVYRSDKKTETYLYLSDNLAFEDLPMELQKQFGVPAFVMRLELTADRVLARADVREVLMCLEDPGYYLQLPPELPVEEEIARRFS